MKNEPKLIGLEGARLSELDGVKLHYAEGFLLLRFSGTEPLVRIYCEHLDEGSELALIERTKAFLGLARA
jgi:phosphomannomutase